MFLASLNAEPRQVKLASMAHRFIGLRQANGRDPGMTKDEIKAAVRAYIGAQFLPDEDPENIGDDVELIDPASWTCSPP